MKFRRRIPKNNFSLISKSGLEQGEKLPLNKKMDGYAERRRPAGDRSPVFSYYARSNQTGGSKTVRHEETQKKRRHVLRIGHLPSYMAYTAIVFAIGYSCYLQPNPKIILVNTPGSIHRDPKVYQETTLGIWKQSILNQTKLTVSTRNLRTDIQNQFSEITEARIELPLLGRRATVTLTPQKPALELVSSNGSFYVNASGKVMGRTNEFIQNEIKSVPLVHDETGIAAEPGKGFVSGTEASFLSKLSAQLKAENITVESITLPANAAKEADVRVTDQKYYIKFLFDNDPRQAVGTYLAAKAKLDAEHALVTEYLDVRVDEKVFYK